MALVSTVSDEFLLQRRDMQLTHDLMGGTEAMIRAGERYLPKAHSGETDKDYVSRLTRTILLNAYKRTVRFCRGQVFKKPVVIEDRKPEDFITQELVDWFKTWSEDVNREGDNLQDWGGDVFESGLNNGVTFCLVDYSAVDTVTDESGNIRYRDQNGEYQLKTQEADKENGWGPYLIHVPAGRVIDCRLDKIGGVQRCVHFRYMEDWYEETEDWKQERRQRIRVFIPGKYEIWENSTDMSEDFTQKTVGELKDERGQLLPYVPVSIFMPGDKRTAVTAEPALQDLAQLNKRHWQATSAQAELMEFVRRPVWFGRSLGDGDKPLVFGPGVVVNCSSDYATLQNMGIDSGSVAAGRQELQDLEGQMAMYGLQLLQPNNGGAVTATEVNQDTEESISTLQDWALRFQNFLENILRDVALWKAEEDGPSVKVNTELTRMVSSQLLLTLQQNGVLSKRTLLDLLIRAGILPDDFDTDAEPDRIAQELNSASGPSGPLNLADLVNRGRQNRGENI